MERNTGSVLITDGGGRGAALAEAYARSLHVDRILVAPGNDLIYLATLGKPVEIFPGIKTTDVKAIVGLAREKNVALVDVAQDNAVESGLTNALEEAGIDAIGPTREAGQIEWDKGWARKFGEEIGLPQPMFKACSTFREGYEYLDSMAERRWFVKASGLVAGKGALPAENSLEARKRIREVLKLGNSYVLEEWLVSDDGTPGREFSAFIMADGENFQNLGYARDHKRLLDGDQGPNTGGMGVVAPLDDLSADVLVQVDQIFQKTVKGLKDTGRPYKGVLYLGGMIVVRDGKEAAYVIEFNARHGDPEAEAFLPGIKTDYFELGKAVSKGDMGGIEVVRDNLHRVSVAGVSREYPYATSPEREIFGLEEASKTAKLYGAGVKRIDGRDFVGSGRLFHLVGEGSDRKTASERACEAMSRVRVEENGLRYRSDIGRNS